MFRIGQKIVCVDNVCSSCLRRGHVYVCHGNFAGSNGNVFVQVDCCGEQHHHRPSWFSSRFRPLVERKTDISVFKKMLTPTEVVA